MRACSVAKVVMLPERSVVILPERNVVMLPERSVVMLPVRLVLRVVMLPARVVDEIVAISIDAHKRVDTFRIILLLVNRLFTGLVG